MTDTRSLPSRMTRSERTLAILATLSIVIVFATALLLQPDPRGFGTHQQLGLPECTLRQLTGVSCPHCGMTTSFCWFVRGEFGKSWHVNPAGFIAAVFSLASWPWWLWCSWKGRWFGISDPWRALVWLFATWTTLAVLFWMFRLFRQSSA